MAILALDDGAWRSERRSGLIADDL